MPFTPTTFINNSSPAISATELNKLGGQYAAIANDIADTDTPVGAAVASIAGSFRAFGSIVELEEAYGEGLIEAPGTYIIDTSLA